LGKPEFYFNSYFSSYKEYTTDKKVSDRTLHDRNISQSRIHHFLNRHKYHQLLKFNGVEIMKPQKVLNNLDQSSEDITEGMSAVNDPECQFDAKDLLIVFKKNLEMLRDNYLQLTEAAFYLEVAEALEQTKHRTNPVDLLQVDWVSRNPLLNHYEANLKE
jgi:hypothetical protein